MFKNNYKYNYQLGSENVNSYVNITSQCIQVFYAVGNTFKESAGSQFTITPNNTLALLVH